MDRSREVGLTTALSMTPTPRSLSSNSHSSLLQFSPSQSTTCSFTSTRWYSHNSAFDGTVLKVANGVAEAEET